MGSEADRVVVELIAKNEQFDAAVKQSAAGYEQGMKRIETSGAGAETSHKRLTASVGNSRIAMLEFQHIARGTADQIAAGAPLTQVLAQHMGMLGQAISLAGGTFGKFGAFLGGPWGLALTVAAAGVATLILRHKEETDTVEAVLKKRMKMHEQTLLNKQADEAWSHTIDGLIESLDKANESLGKRLQLQPVVEQQSLQSANATLLTLGRRLFAAEANPNTPAADLEKLRQAFAKATREVYQATLALGESEGAALNDANKLIDRWVALQTNHIRYLQGVHPELLSSSKEISGVFDALKKAMSDAAQVDIPLDPVSKQVVELNAKLAASPSFIQEYIKQMRALAAQLEATAEAAKKAGKIDPIAQFKGAVIGAEGSGANRMGSSAAGIGQFMPDTWMKYFKEAYPDQAASLSRETILDLRNKKEVAVGVIDVATKDYVSVLESAGQKITAAALYTMHLLSAGDPKGRVALRLLTAPAGEATSDFLSAGVRGGNPFLSGTAGDARAAIARRIGDSSGAVSSGAVAIQRELDSLVDENSKKVVAILNAKQKITLEDDLQIGHVRTLNDIIDSGILPSMEQWEKAYDRVKAGEQELLATGNDIIDTVLNPDNWSDWGDMGKRVLHELELEILKLGLINPLKNLLGGSSSNLPTLLGTLTGLFGGGSKLATIPAATVGNVTLPALHFAAGGAFKVNGGTDTNVLSINGQGRAMVSGDETIAVIPSNARAASPMSGQVVQLVLGVEASEYFDARVLRTAGPIIARSSVAAANGGATIARRNLGREAMHRLD